MVPEYQHAWLVVLRTYRQRKHQSSDTSTSSRCYASDTAMWTHMHGLLVDRRRSSPSSFRPVSPRILETPEEAFRFPTDCRLLGRQNESAAEDKSRWGPGGDHNIMMSPINSVTPLLDLTGDLRGSSVVHVEYSRCCCQMNCMVAMLRLYKMQAVFLYSFNPQESSLSLNNGPRCALRPVPRLCYHR
jgi:hypothetical protein